MPFFRKAVLTIPAALLSYYCFAQQQAQNPTDTLDTHLKSSLQSWYKKYPAEKLFAHVNQDVYSSGETLWYKIYAIAYGKPSALSRVVYVQLSDSAGNIVTQNKLPLVEGKAHGNINIDPKLKSGWYKLSAFTSWLMNFDHESYFNQKIYIHNSSAPGSVTAEKEVIEKGYHIAFFPEGGDLVNGSIATVAFKAFSDDGLPARVDGLVKDKTGKIIASLATVHDGMGRFVVEPASDNLYTATARFPDGSTQVVKLPAVKAEGVSLRAGQDVNVVKLQVVLSTTKKGAENCLLAAVQNNGVVNTYPLQLSNGFNEFSLPNAPFSTGILRLTLFNGQGVPLSERLLFINKHDLKTSGLTADTLSFSPHGSNSFSITVKDEASRPVQGNFSVAVTDGNAFNDAISQNIYSALLLSPELKGEVYNPGYYFKNESDTLAQQLDLVMLTNGWRHFSWQKILSNENYTLSHPVEHSIYIAGKVVGYSPPPINDQLNVKLMIFNHDSTKFMGYAAPDSSGSFILKDFNHEGISDIYLQTANKKGHARGLKVKLFNTLDDSLRQAKADGFSEPALPDLTGYFVSRAQAEVKDREFSDNIMLKTVNVKASKLNPTDKVMADHVNPKYTSDREFTLDLVTYPSPNINWIEYIRGRFPNLVIIGDKTSPQFIYRGGNTLGLTGGGSATGTGSGSGGTRISAGVGSFETEMGTDGNQYLPYFYLNEALVPYPQVKDIPMVEIALIRFVPPPTWFAPFNGGNEGAILIYTKQQSDEVRDMAGISSQYDHYIFNGYSITREFAQPDYGKLKQSGLMDDRITLYWNHDLEPDANGVLKFKFNNNDITKKYHVIIQGMDNEGRLTYIQKVFQQQ